MIMDSSAYGAEAVDSPAARELAKRTAVEGIVLLKNDGSLLPMDGKEGRPDATTAKIAFIGPAVTMTQDLLSAPQYHGQNQLVESHSPLMVARGQKGWHVTYSRGCNIWCVAVAPVSVHCAVLTCLCVPSRILLALVSSSRWRASASALRCSALLFGLQ